MKKILYILTLLLAVQVHSQILNINKYTRINGGDLEVDTCLCGQWFKMATRLYVDNSSGGGALLAFNAPLTGGSYNGSVPVSLGITQADATHNGYLSSTDWNIFNNKPSTTIYTGDGSLTGNRTVDLNGNDIDFHNGGFVVSSMIENLMEINQISFTSHIEANDGTSSTLFRAEASTGNDVRFTLESNNSVNNVSIVGDAQTSNVSYTANTHTFNGAIVQPFSTLIYGATTTWDMATGDDKILTLTGDANLVFSNAANGNEGTLIVVQDIAGGHILTVPDQVLTINMNPGDTTVVGFKYDGTAYYWASSAGGGGGGTWGTITGTLSDQTDLQAALDAKLSVTTAAATYQPLDADLTALAALSTTGMMARTAANTYTMRTLTGTTNRLDITNGTGVSGNPTFDISTSYVGQSSITTLGTIGTGTWQGGVVAGLYGGTGVANSGKTITLGGNLTTSGAFNTTFTVTGSNTITFPNASITVARTDAAQTFTGVQTFSSAPVFSTGTVTANSVTHTFPSVAGTVMEAVQTTITSSATPTPAGDARRNEFYVTAQAAAGAFAAPSGTPAKGNILIIRIKDNGTLRAITWDAIYAASPDLPLPNTTEAGKVAYWTFVYNDVATTWDLVGSINGR